MIQMSVSWSSFRNTDWLTDDEDAKAYSAKFKPKK